jgi:DNA-3-methyladenine glycosylase I
MSKVKEKNAPNRIPSATLKPPKRAEKIKLIDAIQCEDGLTRPPWAAHDPLMRSYYDTEWGMPIHDEQGLFERVSLEAFQAGLSWATILRKRDAFRAAFDGFDPDTIAKYTERDIERLMNNADIIRNRPKIVATINNAQATVKLREDGGLAKLIWSFKPATTPTPRTMADIPTSSAESVALSKALRKRGFAFVGPTTMYALMEATGIVDTHLLDSHRRGSSRIWKWNRKTGACCAQLAPVNFSMLDARRSRFDKIHRPQKVELSNVHTIFAQNRVSHANVEIDIWNCHLKQVVLPFNNLARHP